jgi:hypothetical protein
VDFGTTGRVDEAKGINIPKDSKATLRERDSMQQIRVPLDELPALVRQAGGLLAQRALTALPPTTPVVSLANVPDRAATTHTCAHKAVLASSVHPALVCSPPTCSSLTLARFSRCTPAPATSVGPRASLTRETVDRSGVNGGSVGGKRWIGRG